MPSTLDNGNSLFEFVFRDGNGVKGLVDRGLSKVPQAYIQPPEERIDTKKASKLGQPPIDLSKLDGPDHDEVVKEVVRGATNLGFFQVINHGLPVELLSSLKDAAHNFFGQPAERKSIYRMGVSPTPLIKYGTSFAPEKERAFEWVDHVGMVYTNDDEFLQHWPTESRELVLEYLKTSLAIVKKLINVLMEDLGVKLEDSKIEALIGRKKVNINFYPACPDPDLTVGVGRHSDVGTLTVLLQDGIGGLYVNLAEDTDIGKGGQWVEIPPIHGALVINIGDMLQILSNGKYKSAEHRVRTTNTKSRVSIPVFTFPSNTEIIGPLPDLVKKDGVARYREFLCEDYMNNYYGKPHHGKKPLDFARI